MQLHNIVAEYQHRDTSFSVWLSYASWSILNFTIINSVLPQILLFHGLSNAIYYKAGEIRLKNPRKKHFSGLRGMRNVHASLLGFHHCCSWHNTQTPSVVLKGRVGWVHMTALNCPCIPVLHVDIQNHQNHLPANNRNLFEGKGNL